MADTKVSALTAAADLTATDEVYVNQGLASRRATLLQVGAYMGGVLRNASVADQTVAAASTAYLLGSAITVPVGKLRVGTVFKWRGCMAKTAAGTLAGNFQVKFGTAGTTADTTRITFNLPAGTAVVDQGYFDLVLTVRGPLSASGVVTGVLNFTHNLATTGLIVQQASVLSVTSGAFDVTVANLIVGLSCTTNTSVVWTFQQMVAEVMAL